MSQVSSCFVHINMHCSHLTIEWQFYIIGNVEQVNINTSSFPSSCQLKCNAEALQLNISCTYVAGTHVLQICLQHMKSLSPVLDLNQCIQSLCY